jgi:hypothetical protein
VSWFGPSLLESIPVQATLDTTLPPKTEYKPLFYQLELCTHLQGGGKVLDMAHIATFLVTGLPVIATSVKGCLTLMLDVADMSMSIGECASV